jgi:hypothetical protein
VLLRIFSGYHHPAFLSFKKTGKVMQQGGFAAAVIAYNAYHFTSGNIQVNAF